MDFLFQNGYVTVKFPKTLYWHDYETWGETPARDRPVQFAGIRTDESLNIISEPLMIYSRPASDVLPKPDACLITRINPFKAKEQGVSECEFMAKIVAELGRPGTCGVGYNSIRFDDEVTRYSLYRNFFDPYEREWKNGNSRWDLIDVVRMMRALRPEGMEWPFYEDGTPCNKLEALSQANGLLHAQAHDALSDVYATIELAKCIRKLQPKLFDYAYSLRNKRAVSSLLDVDAFKPMLHTSSRFPSEWLNTTLIVPVAYHPTNRNSVICFNLRQNPKALLSMSAEAIREKLYVKAADLPEGEERIALKEVHLNRSPMLATPALLSPEVIERIALDVDACAAHAQVFTHLTFSEREALRAKLETVFGESRDAQQQDVDLALYGGFINDADRELMYELRKLSPEGQACAAIIFEDERLNGLLPRYQGRNFEEYLSEENRLRWLDFCRKTLDVASSEWGFNAFFERIQLLMGEKSSPDDQHLLAELKRYGEMLQVHIKA